MVRTGRPGSLSGWPQSSTHFLWSLISSSCFTWNSKRGPPLRPPRSPDPSPTALISNTNKNKVSILSLTPAECDSWNIMSFKFLSSASVELIAATNAFHQFYLVFFTPWKPRKVPKRLHLVTFAPLKYLSDTHRRWNISSCGHTVSMCFFMWLMFIKLLQEVQKVLCHIGFSNPAPFSVVLLKQKHTTPDLVLHIYQISPVYLWIIYTKWGCLWFFFGIVSLRLGWLWKMSKLKRR